MNLFLHIVFLKDILPVKYLSVPGFEWYLQNLIVQTSAFGTFHLGCKIVKNLLNGGIRFQR